MTPRGDKIWQFRPAAATLLAAYLLVLQGLTGGLTGAARYGGIGLFGSSICFNKSETPLDRSIPARPSRHSDACCVFHCGDGGGGGTATAFWDETPDTVGKTQARQLALVASAPQRQSTPPVGARAPPATVPVTTV